MSGGAGGSGQGLTIPELGRQREKTETISSALRSQLEAHLETLRPLLSPRRLLGKYLGASRDEAPGAEKVVADLEERYRGVAGAPFVLRPQLDQACFRALETRVELHPWEYIHRAQTDGAEKLITIRSPVRWVMSYASDYSPFQLRDVLAGKSEKRAPDVAQFVVNALVMHAMVVRFPGLAELLRDLRFEISIERAVGLGELPLVVLNSNLRSFRPGDELLIIATGFSGVAAFIELVDRDAVAEMRDPLRERLEQAMR